MPAPPVPRFKPSRAGYELGDGAFTCVYEKLSSAVDEFEFELGVPDPMLRFGWALGVRVGAGARFEGARIIFKEVGPLGCLTGIGVGAVAFVFGIESADKLGFGRRGDGVGEVFDGPATGTIFRELVRLGVVGCFRGTGARGLSSSEPESHASSSAQSELAWAAVMMEK